MAPSPEVDPPQPQWPRSDDSRSLVPRAQASPPSTPRDAFANLRERAASFVSGFLPGVSAAPPVNVRQRAITSAPRAQPSAPGTNFVDSIIMRAAAPVRPPAAPDDEECSSFAMWWQQHLQLEHTGYVERGWDDA